MSVDRRTVLLGSLVAAFAAPVKGAPLSTFGLDAAHFGVRPGATGDQSSVLQPAIDQAARTRAPLMLAPGVYRAGGLTLPAGASLVGIRGTTGLILTHGPSLISAEHADTAVLQRQPRPHHRRQYHSQIRQWRDPPVSERQAL
jgi:uncharacterized secreted repeat protein (TIGR03808 family)